MSSSAAEASPVAEGPKYGRFTRRVRGLAIDFMLFLLVLVIALSAATSSNSDTLARTIGFTVVAAYFLYEPLLVSTTGSTIGHYFSNLRVVDNRTGGNVSFLKALARALIKTALGLYSFVTMVATRRHQAVHDVLTRSTVQMRDSVKAEVHHYVGERTELSSPSMPSRLRRALVIIVYVLVLSTALAAAEQLLSAAGILLAMSRACLDRGLCTDMERLQNAALGFCVIAIAVLCIGLGWRGRLSGARRDIDADARR